MECLNELPILFLSPYNRAVRCHHTALSYVWRKKYQQLVHCHYSGKQVAFDFYHKGCITLAVVNILTNYRQWKHSNWTDWSLARGH